jgi:hypothetical protein
LGVSEVGAPVSLPWTTAQSRGAFERGAAGGVEVSHPTTAKKLSAVSNAAEKRLTAGVCRNRDATDRRLDGAPPDRVQF